MILYKDKTTRRSYNDTAIHSLQSDKTVQNPELMENYREYSTNWQRAFKHAIRLNFSAEQIAYLEDLAVSEYNDEQLDEIILALHDNMSFAIINKFSSPITQARQMFYLRNFYYRRNKA